MSSDIHRSVEALWRIESAHIIGTLVRMTGDVGLAEDAAQDALLDALRQWPIEGMPRNPAAWLTAVAKRRVLDAWSRSRARDDRYRRLAEGRPDEHEWQPIPDDVLRLLFTACHPVLAREAQVALTLRLVGGLTSEAIARLFLVPVPTIQQRIVRAKKTLGEARVPFETPEPAEWKPRLGSVLAVIYLIFTEGYAATGGDHLLRTDLADEALRLGRMVTGLVPREPEAHALVALMELQASRFAARVGPTGAPILLADQDRRRWDRSQIARGVAALDRADALGRGRGPYALQAAIARCHATAPTVDRTDWERIVTLYEALSQLAPNPVVDLNRAVAVSMMDGPDVGLALVDRLAEDGSLRHSPLLPAVRAELFERLGRDDEAAQEFAAAASLTTNVAQREALLGRASAVRRSSSTPQQR